jgi:GT2 family glycosyltransferase
VSDPSVSIIVPTFRRSAALRQTLNALRCLDYDQQLYEVIVIDDNGGDDETADVIGSLRNAGMELILENQRQRGAASARNRGARLASGDLLLFCDDDIVVDAAHLLKHLTTRERHHDPIVNAAWDFAPGTRASLQATPFGRFRLDLEREFQDSAGAEPRGDGCLRMPLLGSWDLMLRRDLFWELGGFDEDFPVAGAEDQDFSLRARAAGCLLLLDPTIRCLHNDNRLSLRAYCAREERSARTMPLLARKYPGEFDHTPYIRENRPIARADPPRLVVKKAAKALLATTPALEALHRLTGLLEAFGAPDRALRRLYTTLLGLHLYRGFRRSWT